MKRKCFCDGMRGTDCHWCQGTGYIIESLNLNITRSKLTEENTQPKTKHLPLHRQFEEISDVITNIYKKDNNTKPDGVKVNKITKFRSDSARLTVYEATKEFNIGVTAIIAILYQKGFYVSDINDILTEKMYSVLQVQFTQDKFAKHKAVKNTTNFKEKKIIENEKLEIRDINEMRIIDEQTKLLNTMKIAFNLSDLNKWEENMKILKAMNAPGIENRKSQSIGVVVNKNARKKPKDSRLPKGQNMAMHPNKPSIDHAASKPIINPAFEIQDTKRDYKEERKLDGSRDYYQYREEGKFGSHSVFDDMGDEARP
jgi:hypothetical protein